MDSCTVPGGLCVGTCSAITNRGTSTIADIVSANSARSMVSFLIAASSGATPGGNRSSDVADTRQRDRGKGS